MSRIQLVAALRYLKKLNYFYYFHLRYEIFLSACFRCKAEFLVQLDGLISHSEPILFLASTNLPWTLDPALLRRFQQVLNIDLPDYQQRVAILRKSALSFPGKSDVSNNKKYQETNFESLAEKTEGFSGSDLDRACARAIQKLFRRRIKMKEEEKIGNKNGSKSLKEVSGNFFLEDISESIERIRPLSESWKKKYDKWKLGNSDLNSKPLKT